ncbi:MAG TPA: GGDEF domain-containing protein [Gemmatimonadales bacterium]
MRRALTALLVPEGLLLLGAAAAVRWPVVLAPAAPVIPVLPALVGGVGVVLAIRFRRSGVVLGLLTLAAAGGALAAEAPASGLGSIIAILLPLNLLAYALLPERGLAGAAAARRGAALAAQAAVLLILVRTGQDALLAPLARRTFSAPLLPPGTPVGDAALVASAGALAVLAALLLRQPDPVRRGFLWAVAAALLALLAAPDRDVGGLAAPAFLLTVAALAIVIALVEAAHALAYRDALTSLPNRRALDDELRRLDGPYTIAMADVDHFKAVNDTHGHDVGDQVLRLVAAHLDAVGEGGRTFRYGGEEFAILFPGRAAPDVLDALEAVRAAVAGAPFTLRGPDRPRRRPKHPRRRSGASRLAVTISMGVAQRAAGDATPDATVQRADAALYRAKKGGRNRIASGKATRGA